MPKLFVTKMNATFPVNSEHFPSPYALNESLWVSGVLDSIIYYQGSAGKDRLPACWNLINLNGTSRMVVSITNWNTRYRDIYM